MAGLAVVAGSAVRLTCTLRDAAGVLRDAGDLFVVVTAPDASAIVLSTANFTHPSTGAYYADVTLDRGPGDYGPTLLWIEYVPPFFIGVTRLSVDLPPIRALKAQAT